MKTRMFGLAAVVCFLFSSSVVVAGDTDFRDGHRGGDRVSGSWRLGERTRDGFSIYHRSGGGWYRVPGAAIAVADGWVLGAKRESGGHAIYCWNGHNWDQAPGGAVRIGGTYSRPWVVNNRGQRFVWNGYDWRAEYSAHNGGHTDYRNTFSSGRNEFGHDARDFNRGKAAKHHKREIRREVKKQITRQKKDHRRDDKFDRRHDRDRDRRSRSGW